MTPGEMKLLAALSVTLTLVIAWGYYVMLAASHHN